MKQGRWKGPGMVARYTRGNLQERPCGTCERDEKRLHKGCPAIRGVREAINGGGGMRLSELSDEDLLKKYDELAEGTVGGPATDYFLPEMNRRSAERQAEAAWHIARWSVIMSNIIAAATVTNVVLQCPCFG